MAIFHKDINEHGVDLNLTDSRSNIYTLGTLILLKFLISATVIFLTYYIVTNYVPRICIYKVMEHSIDSNHIPIL